MEQFRHHTLKGAAPSSSESRNWMQTAMFLAWKEKCVQQKCIKADSFSVFNVLDFTHLGEGLLVVIFELLGIDVELVLVGGERAVVLCHLGEKLFDLHRHALAAVLKGFDGNIGRRDRIWGKKGKGVCLKSASSANC